MEYDERLLEEARRLSDGLSSVAAPSAVTARRYLWDPPCLSLGRFQRLAEGDERDESALPFDLARRPSGGRAVLHGRDFEWSFAVVFPQPPSVATAAAGGPGRRSRHGVAAPYEVVSAAMAAALAGLGVSLQAGRAEAYQRSALCFSSSLRYDLLAGSDKVVAVAQARRGRATLVHGSVLERRPSEPLLRAVERLLGEPWTGDGLAAAAPDPPSGPGLWAAFLEELAASLRGGE
jgi:lipoate-protein ligase A